MRGSFLIIAKEKGIITEKGVRAFIMDRLLHSPFSKAAVFNLDEKTVKVMLEGDEKQIREFIENLEKDLVANFGNPTISFMPFREDPSLEVPEVMRAGQALMVGQLQKGIKVQLDILDTLKGLKENDEEVLGTMKELKKGDEGMLDIMKDAKKNDEEMRDILKDLRKNDEGVLNTLKGNHEEMLITLKELPRKLARALIQQQMR